MKARGAMLNRRFLTVPILLLVLALTGGAQWTNKKKDKPRDPTIRSLQGLVTLPDETPAVGAVVKLKNLKTLQVRSYITQKDGKYQFQNLSTNIDYEVTGDFKEFSSPTRTLSVFDSRFEAIINLKLEPGKAKKDETTSN
jgi:hypothetical protein